MNIVKSSVESTNSSLLIALKKKRGDVISLCKLRNFFSFLFLNFLAQLAQTLLRKLCYFSYDRNKNKIDFALHVKSTQKCTCLSLINVHEVIVKLNQI